MGVPGRDLTEREREVLDFLLAADFQGAPALRVQARSARVTGVCGCGCATIDLEVDRETSPRAELAKRVPVEAFGKSQSPDAAGGLLLFADDGWLSGLEIWFTSDEPPREFPPSEMFELPRNRNLPPLVRRYLDRVLPSGDTLPQMVRLTQAGELRLKPGGRWLRFTASQESLVQEVSFSWRARVRMLPLVSVQVVDRYSAGEGSGEVRLFGVLPIMRDSRSHVSEGAALRYLAELPWNPHAMLNRQLEWRELDEQTAEVTTRLPSARLAMRLYFDGEGNIVKTWTDARPHKEGDEVVPRPWGGVYSDYAVVGGVAIPARAEVTWELADGPWTWFRGTITSLVTQP